MHRSRLSALAIFAAATACSKRTESDANEILSKDAALGATLDVRQMPEPLPATCGTVAPIVKPSVANHVQAAELARKGYDAELVGNTAQARSLLSRAVQLDATDKSATYHLGRTSEALGDRPGAAAAYCRYLTLTLTTTESAEARQRVAALTQPTRTVASVVLSGAPTRRHSSKASTTRIRYERPRARTRVATTGAAGEWSMGGTELPSTASPRSPGEADRRTERTDAGDVISVSPVPPVDPAPTSSRAGTHRARDAGIGAVAGAMIGAATGRSVKSAVIGAAAGGVLGAVVGGTR